MPYDVTSCPGKDCPIKQDCCRFTDKMPGRRDFFCDTPYNFVTNSCEYYISNALDENTIRFQAYEIWQKMGCPEGKSIEHWLQAEQELRESRM